MRDRALVAMVAGCGLSCAAVARLRVLDVDPEGGVIAVRRGGRRRAATVARESLAVVRAHWQSLARAGAGGDAPAWPGRQGGLGEAGVRRVVQRRLRGAGVEGGIAALHRARTAIQVTATEAAPAPAPPVAPAAPRRDEGLVLICAPEAEAGWLAATVRALGQSPVVAGSVALGLEIFRARPGRFARVLLWGDGPEVAEAAAECDRVAPGMAQLLR